jgi:hypothetical protein
MRRTTNGRAALLLFLLGAFLLAAGLAAWAHPRPDEDTTETKALKAGEEARGPWWMRQTALLRNGKLATLKTRRWWKKAAALKPGESLILDVGGEAKDRMLVRRDAVTLAGNRAAEALIWVIDDDADGSVLQAGGDRDSDCYVVDYDADGLVDRMVDYIDDNGDGLADEMDLRIFDLGILSYALLGRVVSGQGVLWDLRGFDEAAFTFRTCDPSGDKIFTSYKFDPELGTWSPLGEYPLAFSSGGEKGLRASVRIGVVPEGWDPVKDPDFPVSALFHPWEAGMGAPSVADIRLSYALLPASGKGSQAFGWGLNLGGLAPLPLAEPAGFNANRRPPQAMAAPEPGATAALAAAFQARETGFSWIEGNETPAPGGAAPGALGIAWIWERRPMADSGGPAQKWNVRREWCGKPSAKRELYYSGIDRRIHLLGAEEGWLAIGNFAGLGIVGEVRMFDTNGNGIFDRWELTLANSTRPVRVTQVEDEKSRPVDADPAAVAEFYAKEILPQARAENDKVIAAVNAVHPYEPPPGLAAALASGPETQRRYAQDIVRELSLLALRDYFAALANQVLFADPGERGEGGTWGELANQARLRKGEPVLRTDTSRAWRIVRLLADLDSACGRGDYDRVAAVIAELGKAGSGT